MKITFLGGGNMANALIGGMLKQGFAAADITVIDPGSEARARLAQSYAVNCLESAEMLTAAGDVLVLAVKPQQMKEAVAPLVGKLGNALVISIAAGLDMAALSRWLGGHRQIVRCMPNTPALIGAGITGLCARPEVSTEQRATADRVLRTVGTTVWIEDEAKIDGVTAISGSGPAYVFLFIEALQQAAADLGFTPEQGRLLAIETVQGAAALAANSVEPASVLRERVTSKGGTTAAALQVMADTGVKEGIVAGCMAAAARGQELGKILGAD
ncbi:pyrroline-5-carboxylate reductase [Quatrionicoccus australiensis]|uniref:pyrroline-5-carboxylate reductase n=1 Tax=Quatrionicoccus australiensis TaxID=138118 RepID=UPI001CF8AA73|nr:pyrroline-5-carboxylate reductase [Quatrionicoccus australiensis]UCV14863.1 pyrroline-5-carboxylate reductase [Quatrionicoccus australiensis]